jgi:hypothetical protein
MGISIIRRRRQERNPKETVDDEDELVAALSALPGPFNSGFSDGPISIRNAGTAVPQSSIFELKTRSGRYKKEIDMTDLLPLLFFKQVPNFVVAYHDGRGRFHPDDIHVRSLGRDLQEWERDNKDALERLAVLLHRIIEIAKEDERGLLEVYRQSVDRLEIRQQHGEGAHALPLSLREEWAEHQASDEGSVSQADDTHSDLD